MHESANLETETPEEEEIAETIVFEKTQQEKILKLHNSIRLLKEIISSKILNPLKIYKKTCEDVNTIIGDLHGNSKKP